LLAGFFLFINHRMSELTDLEEKFVAKGGAPADANDTSLPPDFRELLSTLQSDPDARDIDWRTRSGIIHRLLEQLDSADNQVVKMQKRRVIRAELNALHQLDSMDE